MYQLIDGKLLAQKTREKLKKEVEDLKAINIVPKLAVILVGNDPASKVYVRNKSKACQEVGIEYEEILLDENTTMDKLLSIIKKLNDRKDINGILLQSPIPKGLNIQEAFNLIDYRKDVDGFNPINIGKLLTGQDCFISCTPFGIMKMFEEYNINLTGKNAVVIGRSNIVGKPMAILMLRENATVTVTHSKTRNLKEICKEADILIVAIGKKEFIDASYVKDGAVVIDVGIHRDENNKLSGDVKFDEVEQLCSAITPVPGGVGPMTIAMLMSNCVESLDRE